MTEPTFPHRCASPSGLVVVLNRNGSIRRMEREDVVLNLFPGSEVEGGPANVWLRLRGGTIEAVPLLGPRSPGTMRATDDGFHVDGVWRGVRFALTLVLAESTPAWFWHLRLENTGTVSLNVDAVYAQDLALAPYGAIRMNEYYVSQYVDHTPLVHPERGFVVASRQNLAVGGRTPWTLVGTLGHGVGFATDALQLHGLATRAGRLPEKLSEPALPVTRRQHEHAMAVVQDQAVTLAPGAVVDRGFFGWLEVDHPEITSDADVAVVGRVLALPEATPPTAEARGAGEGDGAPPAASLFATAPTLACDDLDAAALARHFGDDRRHVEVDRGLPLSFFSGAHRHVVLQAKERRTLRPHGHILRTGDGLVPDEASLTSTAWMDGVFHSLVTQGHVNINRVLSTSRSYLGLFRAHGLRMFIELADGWHLLGVPSAFAMTPSGCRWLYQWKDGLVAIESRAATRTHELGLAIDVLAGPARRILLSHHVTFGGDDGTEPATVHFKHDADGVVVATDPETDFGKRFPDGVFRFDPVAGTAIERVAGDEALFADGASRREPYLVLVTAPSTAARFRITGGLTAAPAPAGDRGAHAHDEDAAEATCWAEAAGGVAIDAPAGSIDAPAGAIAAPAGLIDAPAGAIDARSGAIDAPSGAMQAPPAPMHAPSAATEVARVVEMLPWLAHDALVHYLAPRGLEQYSGGGWGVRDVCQGPVEYLLAQGRFAPVRDLLLRVYATQSADGDWPQWFTFFARDRGIRAGDSHGDIVFWPLLALAQYLLASEDFALLDVAVPFFHPDGDDAAEHCSMGAHVGRALSVIEARQIPATSLVAYGHGDWNDSLQPADPAMRERLCSTWTVTLQVQTAHALATALRACGRTALAIRLDALAARTRTDFQRLLIPGGTLAGFAYFRADRPIQYLLHPSDAETGIHYRLLPMIHALINHMLTPEQARHHVELMRTHLLAPDGARLFDRPPQYRGGAMRFFQRAESSTYFGREIGIMYTHAHLRYAEAMATVGDADAFWLALRQAIPIGVRDVIPNARLRQANTYASSSDAAFGDRYEAQEHYAQVRNGEVPVEGGWRTYSSGAGIAFRLIHERLFGFRRGRSTLAIDPVLPRSLDGLALDLTLGERPVRVRYVVGEIGAGPVALELNGAPLAFTREPNPYRTGGAVVAMAELGARLRPADNLLTIRLG